MNLELPHRRYNPLTREWVLVSPHRARRPWLGQVEKTLPEAIPAYDPNCYLCPGNARVGGERNPAYTGTFVFDNDFQALLTPQRTQAESESLDFAGDSHGEEAYPAIFNAQPEFGISRVVCFSPRHDLSLPEMSQDAVSAVIEILGRADPPTRRAGVYPARPGIREQRRDDGRFQSTST